MVRQLFIYLGPTAPAEVSWASTGASGKLRSGSGPLAQVPRSPGERLVVLVPGTEVLVTEVALPGGGSRLMRQSLPYLLEENLAAEVEEIHFASSPGSAAGKVAVAAVDRARMTRWLTMLAEAGLQPTLLTPATLAVPMNPAGWTLLLTPEGFLARRGNWRVFAGELANLAHYLRAESSLAAEAEIGTDMEVFNCTGQEVSLDLDWLQLSPPRTAQFLALLAEGFAAGPTLNLLQGDFTDSARWRETFQRWRLPLVAATALILLLGVDASLDYLRLKGETQRLNREIATTFLQAFPGSHRVVNARAQMEQKLKELRGGNRQNRFFALYDKMAPLLAATGNPGLEVLRFHDGRLELELKLASLEILEKLKSDLAKGAGIRAEIRTAENSAGLVRARLSLEIIE
ncbi:MAG: type II secretion system protein GspL [Desulfobulbaceae bacterium]|nr:type II secretion system protein GspL [Desulfobulbaceae bacterium]